jgi:hypothetical protein
MARFILLAAVAGAPPRETYCKFVRGTTIADSDVNAQPGDVVWPSLCSPPTPVSMAPLDASAAALLPGVPITTLAEVAIRIGGGAIEGVGA